MKQYRVILNPEYAKYKFGEQTTSKEITVNADYMDCIGGVLSFYRMKDEGRYNDDMIRGFAPGTWMEIKEEVE